MSTFIFPALTIDRFHRPETVARVREYILSTPAILNNPDAFIRGGGWDHTSWPGAAWPTAVRDDHYSAYPSIPLVDIRRPG
jgi:hypothetical protein